MQSSKLRFKQNTPLIRFLLRLINKVGLDITQYWQQIVGRVRDCTINKNKYVPTRTEEFRRLQNAMMQLFKIEIVHVLHYRRSHIYLELVKWRLFSSSRLPLQSVNPVNGR